jgi:hypothetical protein
MSLGKIDNGGKSIKVSHGSHVGSLLALPRVFGWGVSFLSP